MKIPSTLEPKFRSFDRLVERRAAIEVDAQLTLLLAAVYREFEGEPEAQQRINKAIASTPELKLPRDLTALERRIAAGLHRAIEEYWLEVGE